MKEILTCQKQETEHVVAFLDLLGATKKIESEESEKYLNKISAVFELAKHRWPAQDHFPYENIKCITFSDNIAFAMELTKNPTTSEVVENEDLSAIGTIWQFISYIGIFQSCALEYELLFRGGISIGKLYMNPNENFIWGKALTEAYDLENRVAIYPRVVLSCHFEKFPFGLQKLPYVCKDRDGIYFVDYISQIAENKELVIKKAKKLIQDEYSKALKKYNWLQQYIEQYE